MVSILLPFVQSLLHDLNNSQNPWTAAILSCGQPFSDNLRSNAEDVIASKSIQFSGRKLDTLIDAAYTNIKSSSTANALKGWMRLYADACILRCLSDIGPLTALQSIASLDRVIIVCGDASGRLDLVLSIIENIQHQYLSVLPFTFETTPNQPTTHVDKTGAPDSSGDIKCLSEAPSLLAFSSTLSRQPFIVRRYAQDWPAMKEHPWCSSTYLRAVSGPGRIVPVEIGKDYREDNWTQRLMSWDVFLDSLELADQPPAPEPLDIMYLAQHNLMTQFPTLRADIIVPDYVYASIEPPEYTGYHPPGNDEQLVINAWLGPKGTVSPAHTDPYYNLFAQVVGRKIVWLAPPSLTPYMYPFSPPNDRYPGHADMSNSSRVDVFSDENAKVFPDFQDQVAPKAIRAMLEPGDLLYLPPGWWHAMRSEETSFSMSMWF